MTRRMKCQIWMICMLVATTALADDLDQNFLAPPDSAKPWVYWFWQNGLVSRDGITADLEAMKHAGLRGALWMWAGVKEMEERGPVKFMSPEWWKLMRHTVREADRLGLRINLYNGTGWSHSGGPWVKPELSMQQVERVWETRIQGPGTKRLTIPKGDKTVAVVAYRLHDADLIESSSAIDLTDRVRESDTLDWDAPDGDWMVQVYRHRSTKESPGPVFEDARGLECDKLSPEAIEAHFNGFVRRVLDECGPEARRVIRWVHADSYEFGTPSWTPRFREEFRQRRGYDLLPYLPALTGPSLAGQIVDSTETTERFLWDFRRTRADLFAEGIGGHMRELCRREGIRLTTEPHLVGDVFDQLQYGGSVDEPMGNFLDSRRSQWYTDNPPVGPEMHLAKGEVSAAYTYGLDGVVWAEAFTGIDHAHAWKESPHSLKSWGDLWFTEGINCFSFHYFAQQPWNDRRPGVTLGPWGIHFDRHNTWFDLATGYLKYLTRCQHMLRQGLPVMDVCVLTGDRIMEQFAGHPELRACGYDYHGITPEVLVRDATVKDGWIVLPSGMRYRLLVTYSKTLRPETMQKLRDLVKDGAAIMGIKPTDAPGLAGYPSNRETVRRIAEELWGKDTNAGRSGRPFGLGQVFWGMPEKENIRDLMIRSYGLVCYMSCSREMEVLRALGVEPDFHYRASGTEVCEEMLAFMHRRVNESDLYFVSNQAERSRKEDCAFRIRRKQPELWDPVTGEIRDLPEYREENGRTVVPLEFQPSQSFFVLFRDTVDTARSTENTKNFDEFETLQELTGPWRVSFDPKWGGPEESLVFETLEDWTARPEEGIRHYSGKAIYQTSFKMPKIPRGKRVYLHLDGVKDIAAVLVNGESLGTVWTYPWSVEITNAFRVGTNELEVTVANEWVNRLIGDSRLAPEERITWSTHNPYSPDSPLLPSGLLGPVTVQVSK